MNQQKGINDNGMTPLTASELKRIDAGGILLESAVWMIAAYVGAHNRVTDEEDNLCEDGQTFNRRHGTCM